MNIEWGLSLGYQCLSNTDYTLKSGSIHFNALFLKEYF